MMRNVPDVTWRLFTCVRAHVGIGDYISRLRARPELESAGLYDKTRSARAKGRVFRSRERKAPVVLSYEPSVTQAAWNSMEELEIIHRCHQANWHSPDRHRRDRVVADRHPRGPRAGQPRLPVPSAKITRAKGRIPIMFMYEQHSSRRCRLQTRNLHNVSTQGIKKASKLIFNYNKLNKLI